MGFRLDAFIIGVIIFSFIIAVGSGMIVNMADNYGVEYDDEFGTTYIIIQDMYNDTVTQKEDVFGGEIEEEDALDSAIKGGTSALKLLTSPLKITSSIVGDIQEKTAPAIDIRLYFTTALTVMVTFGLIYLFFRIRSW
jgi:hypothetical protein